MNMNEQKQNAKKQVGIYISIQSLKHVVKTCIYNDQIMNATLAITAKMSVLVKWRYKVSLTSLRRNLEGKTLPKYTWWDVR